MNSNSLSSIFVWPFLVLSVGLVFVTFGEGGFLPWLMGPFMVVMTIVVFIWIVQALTNSKGRFDGNLSQLRNNAAVFSIGFLFPVLVRYIVEAFGASSLTGIIIGMTVGFALVVSGLFMSTHRTIIHANILAGAIILFYIYTHIWGLGDLARVIAAAFGLLVAVTVAVVKLRDKL